ncbi:multicopper oxidase domain-containing protein (plasmid) [Metabacillus halosaccharovorans]|nr:multicopper oxidase domain-containing protein [Metabacillus halosaccharovorans]MCM3444160.1 multicopper oxidase domain-containing protein [Metabacillus halosaccharovorans]
MAVKFKYKGEYMIHFHILEHEDNGMFAYVKVE